MEKQQGFKVAYGVSDHLAPSSGSPTREVIFFFFFLKVSTLLLNF